MNEILEFWDREETESMYDKLLLNQEIDLISKYIPKGSKILDAGCGEGEGTFVYSKIPNVTIHAADFSETRVQKAEQNLSDRKNIKFFKIDFLNDYQLDRDYDVIISQRFLINLMKWEKQKKIIKDFIGMIRKSG